jgi:hypothetical protein
MGTAFYNGVNTLSWLYQWLVWPFFSARILAHRLKASSAIEEGRQKIRVPVEVFDAFVTSGRELEIKLAQAHLELQTQAVKDTATQAASVALEGMYRRFKHDLLGEQPSE